MGSKSKGAQPQAANPALLQAFAMPAPSEGKPSIAVQLEAGLGLPYASEAEQSLTPERRAQWNAMSGAFGGQPPALHPMFNEVPPGEVAQAMAETPADEDGPAPD